MRPGFAFLNGAFSPRAESTRAIAYVLAMYSVGLGFFAVFALYDRAWFVAALALILVGAIFDRYVTERTLWHVHFLFWIFMVPFLLTLSAGSIAMIGQTASATAYPWIIGAVALVAVASLAAGAVPEWRQLLAGRGFQLSHPFVAVDGRMVDSDFEKWPEHTEFPRWAWLVIAAGIGATSVAKSIFGAAWHAIIIYVVGPALIAMFAFVMGLYLRSVFEVIRLECRAGTKLLLKDVDAVRARRSTTIVGRVLNRCRRGAR